MIKTQNLKGTLVNSFHSWSNPTDGQMNFCVRLDDGRLLIIERAMSRYDYLVEEHDTPLEQTLKALYSGDNAGRRLELSLSFTDAHSASVVSLQAGDKDPEYDISDRWRDRGFWDSLFGGKLTGNAIRCNTVSTHYRVLGDDDLRKQIIQTAETELDKFRPQSPY